MMTTIEQENWPTVVIFEAVSAFRKAAGTVALVACLMVSASAVGAQQNTADVVGTVTDTTGAVIPGATVTLTNVGTNISQTVQTSANGDYIFNLLIPGTYSVKVEAKGFKTYSAPNVTVSSGDRARVDAKMEVGDVTQTVEVSGSTTPALQTDTSSLGTLATTQAVEDVPLNGRNVTKLVQLSAGVSQGTPSSIIGGVGHPNDRRQTAAISANGNADNLNDNMVDGMDNNERTIGDIGVRPSVDSIQEINVNTNTYDASVGRTGGAVVDVITKSGSNNFHGSLYEFFRNRVLNTNPGYAFPSNGSGGLSTVLPKPAFRQNQYGGSLGGPIKKDKTFFFADVEKLDNALGIPLTISVPTLCERGLTLAKLQGYTGSSVTCPNGTPTTPGDFSDLSAISKLGGSTTIGAANSGGDLSNLSVPSATSSPFFGLNRLGLEYFSMYPLPNGTGTLNNFSITPVQTNRSTTIDGRIDQHFSDSDSFYGRYSFNDLTAVVPDAFPTVFIDTTTGLPSASGGSGVKVHPGGGNGLSGPAFERQQMLALSYVHVFRPNLLLNLKASYLRLSMRSEDVNFGTNVSNALGFPCNAVSCVNPPGQTAATGLASITLGVASPASSSAATPSYTGFGSPAFLPLFTFGNSFQYMGTLTWNKGSHSIRIGLALVRRQSTLANGSNDNGSFAFNGSYTGVPAADLLEGLSIGGAVRNYPLVSAGLRSWEPSVYIQDDWRTTHWLTLNLGMRYDIFTPFTEVHGRFTNYDASRGLLVGPSIPGAQQTGRTAGVNPDYLNIAPRFGFAATLKHNMVLRGGFGLSFFPINYQSRFFFKNAPFNFSYNCALQQANNSQNPCTGTPYDNGATAHYGSSTGGASSVNKAGGYAFAAGLPVPVLDINQVFAPSAAQCSYSGSLANYGTTCPAATDPYQAQSITSIVPFNLPSEYLEQMDLQLQKAFGQNVVTIGEVTQLGKHVLIPGNNPFPINVISNPTQVVSGSNNPPLATAFPWLAKTSVVENYNAATSAYNSLQATFVRRFSKGLTVQVNYTWAHAMDNTGWTCMPTQTPGGAVNPCFFDNVANTSSPIVVPWFDKGFSWGNGVNDVPDRIAWTFNYELPFGKSLKGFGQALIGGWAINSAGSWQTGLPYSVGQNAANLNGIGGAGNPDQVCSGKSSSPSLLQWFNPSCFKSQTPGTFGNEHPNQLFGPSQKHVDFSLFKEFPVREQIRLQFRAEVFNLFNTPNFSPPGNTTVQYTGCSVQTTRCTAINNSYPTGAITSLNTNESSRQIQFALKLLF